MTPAGGCTGIHSAMMPSTAPVQATPSIQPATGASRPSTAMGVVVVANIRKIAVWSSRTMSSTRSIGQSRRCTMALTPSITVLPREKIAIAADGPIPVRADRQHDAGDDRRQGGPAVEHATKPGAGAAQKATGRG